MILENPLEHSTKTIITKVVSDCSKDEIALDSLAQWAFNPTGKAAGYGIEENYPSIRDNLSERFNLSDERASEELERLREYGTKFMLLAANPLDVRATILELLQTELGDSWRRGIIKRMSKASDHTKRLAVLILYLKQHGFELNVLENALDKLETFHVAAFEKPFSISERLRDLCDVGLLNKFVYTSENRTVQNVHVLNKILHPKIFSFKLKDLKVNTDTKNLVQHLYEKRDNVHLQAYAELCQEHFGIKGASGSISDLDKKIVGSHNELRAISPFMLETIRDEIFQYSRITLDRYELRLDYSMLSTVRESWPDGKVDLVHLTGAQALWRIDSAIAPKIYVYATTWLCGSDFEALESKLEVPSISTLVCVALNQSPDSVRALMKDRMSKYGEMIMVCPTSEKDGVAERLSGNKTPFSDKIVRSLIRALDLSVSTSDLAKPAKNQTIQVGLGTQFGKTESLKILIGMQGTKRIYWSPTLERNLNLGIFGESGSGKTQVIKRIVSQLKENHTPYIVLDSFGEYDSNDPSNAEFGNIVSSGDISINPLEIAKKKSPNEQVYSVLDTIIAIFNLNDAQRAYLKGALTRTYEASGILHDKPETWGLEPPSFADLHRVLVQMEHQSKDMKEMMQKIDSSLTLPLFSRNKTIIPFERLVSAPVVIQLGSLQTNEMKALASEFVMSKLPRFVDNSSGDLQLFVVVDGAPSLFRKHSSSLELLMAARRRGIGIIFPYRDPNNLPEIAFNSTATIMTFRQSDSKVAKVTAERLDTTEQILNKNLTDKFSAVVRFSSMSEILKLSALPYSQK